MGFNGATGGYNPQAPAGVDPITGLPLQGYQPPPFGEPPNFPTSFPGSSNNNGTGASRQIGEFGGYPVGQVDVRTDMMKALETAMFPLLQTLLTNPAAVSKVFGGMGGAVPGVPASGLSSLLFGGSTGQPTPPQSGPGGGPQPPPPGTPAPPNPDGSLPGGNPTPPGVPKPPRGEREKPAYNPAHGAPVYKTAGGGSAGTPEEFEAQRALFAQFLSNAGLTDAQGGNTQTYTSAGRTNNMTPAQIQQQQLRATMDPSAYRLQFMAQGGIMDPNALKIVGEQGPELIAPTPMGQAVVPLGRELGDAGIPGFQPIAAPGGGMGDAGIPGFQPIPAPQPSQTHPNNKKRAANQAGGAQRFQPQQYTGGPVNMMAPPPTQAPGAAVMPQGQQPILLAPGATGGATPPPPGPGTGQFAASPIQGQGTGMIEQLLQQNPEGQTFNTARDLLMGPGGILGGGNAGQGVMQALQPLFQQNLKFGLNELTNRVPSVHNSAAAIEGADLTSRAMNDYNLLAAQAMMQGQQNTLGGLGMLGQLAGQAGGGQFGRAMQAGQLSTQRDLGLGSLGLQQQQQQWNQTVNPTLQLLLAAMGMATPTAYQTVVPGKK